MPARILFVVAVGLVTLSACADPSRDGASSSKDSMPPTLQPFASQRIAMVREQIEARGIDDPRVLDALRAVPRHVFVPENLRSRAYEDGPLPIGYGQTISQPYIVAIMSSLLDLKRDDKVLEIGTGSGYQAAVLAELSDSVYTIEIVGPLARQAEATLLGLGYDGIRVRIGDGYEGWEEAAPFDAIIVTCAPREIPPPLIEQLADGGRMVIPTGERGYQELVLVEKKGGDILKRSVLPVRFVPLTGPYGDR